ncbi:uncharacterized protein LOC125012554 [Mugil cephalus]|uniref:uncharacterized protein LOC125012554 n=1 Tax=Mugil cephalus TaxID=48193 RepID=UPI001FB7E9CD|nr:uncharacterized protein LOC125012554 [Mugil cephalus]
MVNFTLIPVLLCTFSWISVSVSEFYTVEVQPGEEVTLLCSNFSSFPLRIFWFKLVNGANITRISSMLTSDQNTSFYDGFGTGRFNMTSNSTTLFLNIKPVDSFDSGLYFCGLNQEQGSVTVSLMATHLKVREVPTDEFTNVTTVILAGVTVFLLIIIICLVVIIHPHNIAQYEEVNPQHTENMGSDSLNSLSFRPKVKSRRRPAAERELETHVVYAATR